jgi:hypothetical protein
MPPRVTRQFNWATGFDPTQTKAGGISNSVWNGQNAWIWGAGLIQSAKAFAGTQNSEGVNPIMNVGDTYGGVTTGGTVTDTFGSTWFAGVSGGTAYKGTTSLGPVFSSLGFVRLGTGTAVGLNQPAAPTLADSGGAGLLSGSYSIAITRVDTVSGQESTRSLPSLPITLANHKVTITFPAPLTMASTGVQDAWGIYASFANFGATGPWFFLMDVNASTVGWSGPFNGGTVTLDWTNGQLTSLEAPIDYDPPPPCDHLLVVNNVMVAAGCYAPGGGLSGSPPAGGAGLSPSVPGVPGAYPPDSVVFIPGGGAITGCKATGFSGSAMVSTAQSLNAVVVTNSDITPITVRQVWPTTGFATANAWCTIEDEVYGFSGQRGAVRTQGDGPPDTSFANAVHKFFADNLFTASNTVVVYDPQTDSVFFCSGNIALPFARSRGWWHTPMVLPNSGAITACTIAGHALIDCGSNFLVQSENGGDQNWFVTFAYDDGGQAEFNKTFIRARAATSDTISLTALTNLNDSPTIQTTDPTKPGFQWPISPNHSAWKHLNIRNSVSFTISASGTKAGQSLYEVVTQVVPHPVTTFDSES